VHALELRAAVDQLGRGKAQFGKFGSEDEGDGGVLVAVQPIELFGLLLARRTRAAWRATGWPPCRRGLGWTVMSALRLLGAGLFTGRAGRLVATLPLE
jgi:hypothetical protein